MRIKLLSKTERQKIQSAKRTARWEAREQKVQQKVSRIIKWHEHFCWFPTRINSKEIAFWEKIYRKGRVSSYSYKDGIDVTWEYKSVFDFLKENKDSPEYDVGVSTQS